MTLVEPSSHYLSADRWDTTSEVEVIATVESVGTAALVKSTLESTLDRRRGMLLFRGEDRLIGYVDPPIEIVTRGRALTVAALNDRGRILLPALRHALHGVLDCAVAMVTEESTDFSCVIPYAGEAFAEEDRTRHAGVFTAIRALVSAMSGHADTMLGLYGAFGYDLIFQVEPIQLRQRRDHTDRDMVLHLPDEVFSIDLRADEAIVHRFDFVVAGATTVGMPRMTPSAEFVGDGIVSHLRDHAPGEYAEVVSRAMPLFQSGDLFEVVPSQVFRRPCHRRPSEIFRALRERNPAPHSLLMNLGEREYLVGASPEMFVRVQREDAVLVVESSPISGTAPRGADVLEDASRIRDLLASVKEESELTMCTDVDRNDKARVCVPGTVEVTARRQIELYSALIHTVDRVRGVLRSGYDGLDGFLAHLWAVTVTGAPKMSAVEFIERNERSPRRWYGGAVGRIGFDGTLDTVLTLRTIHIRDGVAAVRAGATLLHDSTPAAEEAETELKAKALLAVLDGKPVRRRERTNDVPTVLAGEGKRILVVDHRDSFVHCLADYFRQTGAEVATYRSGRHMEVLRTEAPDLVVLSPGPGRPADFDVAETLAWARNEGVPVFGICLGLQAIVEEFGGSLGTLVEPMHGKSSRVRVLGSETALFQGIDSEFEVGRYHSLYADLTGLPADLRVTCATDDGVVMALEHRTMPFMAVQFHPESIMSATGRAGHRIIHNAVSVLTGDRLAARR